ncbi:MAG: ABC transporter ATP-binding protein [Mycobacteriales bacterium]
MPADDARTPALRCARLRVEYAGRPAVDDVDLAIAPGELVAVLGESGAGKSTLLAAVAGLVPLAAGEIWLSGRQVAGPGRDVPPEHRAVGMVFQQYALWPHLCALDTVAYPMRRAGQARPAARARAAALLDQLGVGHLAHRRPAELSGGEQQRVGLARALARDAAVYLFDEPTAHLDPQQRLAFQAEVRRRQRAAGAAALYATHDAGEALALADRVAVLVGGHLAQLAPPAGVYGHPASIAVARLTGAASVLDARLESAGTGDGAELVLRIGGELVAVPGGPGITGAAHVVVRPEWTIERGPFRGTVTEAWFHGAHTDYVVEGRFGTVTLRRSGQQRHAIGEQIEWGLARGWAVPTGTAGAGQPSAIVAPG